MFIPSSNVKKHYEPTLKPYKTSSSSSQTGNKITKRAPLYFSGIDSYEPIASNQQEDTVGIIVDIFDKFSELSLSDKGIDAYGHIFFLNALFNSESFKQQLFKERKLTAENIESYEQSRDAVRSYIDALTSDKYENLYQFKSKENFSDFVKSLQTSYRKFVGGSNNFTAASLQNWIFSPEFTDKYSSSYLISQLEYKPIDFATSQNGGINPYSKVQLDNDSNAKINKKTNQAQVIKEVISEAEYDQLLDKARTSIKKDILCQENAIDTLVNKFIYHYCNQTDESHNQKNRESQPWIRGMLYGPTGVGKTSAAEMLANALDRPIEKIDLNAYKTEESVSRFTGAESGRKGFMSGCSVPERIENLINSSKRPPIVIFDEIEKAHPHIQHMIMGLLDYGKMPKADLTNLDAKGIDIIATTNAGVSDINGAFQKGISGEKLESIAEEALEKEFPPEVIARFNAKIFFKPIEQKDSIKIIEDKIKKTTKNLTEKRNMSFTVSEEAKGIIQSKVYNARTGTRGLQNALEAILKEPVILKAKSEFKKEYFNKEPLDVFVTKSNSTPPEIVISIKKGK